ncbi:MAG: GDSL-type esterase/lipase family protein [Cyanobacteria bacterium P01_D01_bin.156]
MRVGSLLTYLGIPLVGVSVACNVYLFGQLKKYYVELNQVRLDPLGLSYYSPGSQVAEKKEAKRVVFFGDSRAQGWPNPNIEGYEFINRGINGQTSIQTSQRFSHHLADLEPDIVVVQVGINDLKTIPLMPDIRNVIIDLCRANIRKIVEDARELGATVIISTILPVGEASLARKFVWSDDIAQAIYEVNGYIDSLADEQVLVFDSFSAVADNEGLIPLDYRRDELHLNEQGYDVLNQAFIDFFESAELFDSPNTDAIATENYQPQ